MIKHKTYNLYIYRLIIVILSTLSITIFWENTNFTLALLIVFAILINLKSNSAEILAFILVAILATLLEALANSTGAWEYVNKDILNFPIWLPLYWGMGGIVMKDIYNFIYQLTAKR